MSVIFLQILKEKALEYRNEHFQYGEKIINGSELFDKTESYEEWLSSVPRNINPETVNENWVVTDTFFAIRKRGYATETLYQLLQVAKEAEMKELHITELFF